MKFKAFTMAEAILVMTILGIIATIMITTLKPATYKEQALRTLADKVIGEIDIATNQILLNDTADGTFRRVNIIYHDRKMSLPLFAIDSTEKLLSVVDLYKKYLVTKRATNAQGAFTLKDGADIQLFPGVVSYFSVLPGETVEQAQVSICHGLMGMEIDINGKKNPPNILGKDRFTLILDKDGINYNPLSVEDAYKAYPQQGCDDYLMEQGAY